MKNYPLQYTLKKFKRFIPYIVMTATMYVAVSMFCNHFVKHFSFRDTLLEFSGLPFDVFLMQITGICKNPSFNAWWYLSAVLFTLPIVIVLFCRKICFGGVEAYIVYFIPLLIYGAFSVEVNGLDWDREVFGIAKSGIFRCFAGLCMGCIIYDLKDRLKAIEITVVSRIILTIVECASYLFSVLIAWRWSEVNNSTFLIVLLLVMGLAISFSNESYTVRLNYSFFKYFGMVSLPLYMCHYSVGKLIERYFIEDKLLYRYLVYFACSLIFAIFMLIVDRKILKGGSK